MAIQRTPEQIEILGLLEGMASATTPPLELYYPEIGRTVVLSAFGSAIERAGGVGEDNLVEFRTAFEAGRAIELAQSSTQSTS
jgi:hypothetical protein